MTDLDDDLRQEFSAYQVGDRTASAALLAWFLENIWGLEPETVPDSICDKSGDKGIDGVVIDEDTLEITLFQTKCFDDPAKRKQGDKDLRDFMGAAKWFANPRAIEELFAAKINLELRNLITRNNLLNRLSQDNYSVNLVFITNGELSTDASEYAAVCENVAEPPLEVWDRLRLTSSLEHVKAASLNEGKVSLKTSGGVVHAEMNKKGGDAIAIALVSAKELIKLPGIADRTLFSRNVRLYRGLTNVNKGLRNSLQSSEEHAYFPAYHNGLTLVTEKLTVRKDGSLSLDGVGVVNGCQSLVTLYDNRTSLTSKLRVVVKVVEAGSSDRVEKITYRSNNQNAVTMRDQRSTDIAMRSLQSRISERFGTSFALSIRVGETLEAETVMENTLAAQLVMACYKEEPWAAVRKVRLFEDDYRAIFNRKTTPERVYLLHLIDEAVKDHREELTPDLRASYAAVRFTLVYLVSIVLKGSERGTALLSEPGLWIFEQASAVRDSLSEIALEAVQTLNEFVESSKEDDAAFDPKTIFKSRSGVISVKQDLERDARRAHRKGAGFYFDLEVSGEGGIPEDNSKGNDLNS